MLVSLFEGAVLGCLSLCDDLLCQPKAVVRTDVLLRQPMRTQMVPWCSFHAVHEAVCRAYFQLANRPDRFKVEAVCRPRAGTFV